MGVNNENLEEEVQLRGFGLEPKVSCLVEYRMVGIDHRGLKLARPYLAVRIEGSEWWPVQLIMNIGEKYGLKPGDNL